MVFLCVNVAMWMASDKCDTFVIVKSKNPYCFRGATKILVCYHHNMKA